MSAITYKKLKTKQLLLPEHKKLLEGFLQVYFCCYDGWTKEKVLQVYLQNNFEDLSIIKLALDGDQVVGFNITNFSKFKINNKARAVMQVSVCVNHEYRGKVKLFNHTFFLSLFYKLSHPFLSLFYVDIIMNFRVYDICLATIDIFPHPKKEMPAEWNEIRLNAAKLTGLKILSEDTATMDEIVIGGSKQYTPLSQEGLECFMKKTKNDTEGLLVIVPCTLLNIAKAIVYSVVKNFRK